MMSFPGIGAGQGQGRGRAGAVLRAGGGGRMDRAVPLVHPVVVSIPEKGAAVLLWFFLRASAPALWASEWREAGLRPAQK
jgi:hypothetical protein